MSGPIEGEARVVFKGSVPDAIVPGVAWLSVDICGHLQLKDSAGNVRCEIRDRSGWTHAGVEMRHEPADQPDDDSEEPTHMSEKTEIERLDELWREAEGAEGVAGLHKAQDVAITLYGAWPEIKAVLPVDDDDLNAAIRRELGEEPEGER